MTVLALTGYPASGKSTAASILEDAGWPVVGMGDVLRDTVSTLDEEEVWAYAEELREDFGPHGVAVPCVARIREHLADHDLVVLEGTRNPAELEYLEAEVGAETVVIWIAADRESRIDWFSAREGRGHHFESRDDAAQTLSDRTDRERDAGMRDYFTRSDVIVHNNRTQADLAYKIVNLAFDLIEE